MVIALLAGVPANITTEPAGTSLISYYPFNNSTAESSGNSGTTLTTTGSVSYVAGFDGTASGAVYLANETRIISSPTQKAANYLSGSFTQTGAFTVSLWINATKLPFGSGFSQIIGIGTASGQIYGFEIAYNADTYAFGNGGTGAVKISINNWYHLVGVFIPSVSVSFYCNGTYIGSTANTNSTVNGSLFVGDSSATSSYKPYAGYVDDLRIYNRVLRPDEIAFLAGNTRFPTIPSLNLKGSFPFEGNFTDASGNNMSLTSTGTIQYVNGVTGSQALYLANEANVSAGTAAANYLTGTYSFPATFSVSLWASSTAIPTTANWNMVFYTTNTGSSLTNAVFLGFYGTAPSYTINCGFAGTAQTTSSFIAAQNTWYHLAITYNNGSLSLYINGSLRGSTSGTMAQSGFIIGTNAPSGQQPFAGYIDDYRIYSYALTTGEVAELYYGTAQIVSPYASLLNATPTPAILYRQTIPGVNVSDLWFGSNLAQPVTASMWIKNKTNASQTFTISLNNANASARSYLYNTPSIAADSWSRIAFTIPGDVTGTWATSTSPGWAVNLCLGANPNVTSSTLQSWVAGMYHAGTGIQSFGASGAMLSIPNNALYVTGIQIEKGTVVTPYEYRPYGVEALNLRGGMMTMGTAVSTLSGTSVTFTGIPSWVKRITVMINGSSTNGTSHNIVQLGSGGVIQTTGYLSYWGVYGSTNIAGSSNSTIGFGFYSASNGHIKITIMTIINISGTTWISSHSGSLNDSGSYSVSGGGNVTLVGVLDQIRLTTVNGTDTFDAGSVNILYE